MDTPSPLRAPSGVHPSPLSCACGASARALDLDGLPACAACAAVVAADPTTRDDAAERLAEQRDAMDDARRAAGFPRDGA